MTMQITIQLEAQLRQVAGFESECVELPSGANLPAAVEALAIQHSESLKDRVLNADGQLQRGLLVFVNDQPVAVAAAHQRTLAEGDTVLLCPPISGG